MADEVYQNGADGTGRALVAIAAALDRPVQRPPVHLPLVAQLLAERLDLPQTRARRRACASCGTAVYAAGRLENRIAGTASLVRHLA